MEEKYSTGTVGPDTPMTLDIQTEDILNTSVKYLGLKPVTNPINFERDRIPTVNGLFSDYIFGTTAEERKRQWAYIDLNCKIFHPFIYKTFCKLQQNFAACCAGEGSWKVSESGDLIRMKNDDPDYNEENSGMTWIVKNIAKIKFKRNKSRERNERIDMLATFTPDEYIIDKWLVQPVFYRDIEGGGDGGSVQVPPINKEYLNLIRYAKSLNQKAMGFAGTLADKAAKFNIQKTTLSIHNYFQQLIEKSDGFFKQYVIGKNPDYGCRSVISCMVLDQYDKPSEVPIDTNSCGVPLAEVCVIIYPFIQRWIMNYLSNQFESTGNKMLVLLDDGTSREMTLDDPMSDFSTDFIKKKIDKWIDNYESRFEPIMVRAIDGHDYPLVFTGRPFDTEATEQYNLSGRCFTWTDLIYIAAHEASSDKHIWVTRYPLISYAGVFPCKIHILSTIKTEKVILRINGSEKEFPFYPVVIPDASVEQISTAFNDTINMDNSFLDAIGGDYDGDTVSLRSVFSVEANQETEDIIMSKKQYINAQGNIIRTLGNEAILCLYSWTRQDPKKATVASIAELDELLSLQWQDVGIAKLTEIFAHTTDMKTKKVRDPKHRVYDTVKLGAGQYINKEAVTTTLGLLMFNKVCIEPYISKILKNGYWNTPLNNKGIDQLMSEVSKALEYDKITTEELWPWLKAIQFYAYKGTTIFSPSFTRATLIQDKAILAERDKFFKDNPNPTTAEVVSLEEQLTAHMAANLSDDDAKILFDSGAKAKLEDQLKNINTMIGPVYNPETGEMDIITNSFLEGFKKEDIYKAGNMNVAAAYPKAVGTADAGYITKQFYAAFGGVIIDKDGSDCHTTGYIEEILTDDNWSGYEGQNIIIADGKYETLTYENYTKFLNKKVRLRSPMACIGKRVCSVCVGRRPYLTGMVNIGVQFAEVPNKFLNAGMKKFHTTKVKIDKVNQATLFI